MNEPLMKLAEVQAALGMSRGELFAAVARKELAEPVKRGFRVKGWRRADVEKARAAR